jgi:uncharacterized membrane protein
VKLYDTHGFPGERRSTPNWLGAAVIVAGAVLFAYKS